MGSSTQRHGRILGVIPARGGSKRVPRKNLRLLGGKPLLSYTIQAALNCPLIARTIVSTDDQEIHDVARATGADVPFLRPAALASDDATTVDVVLHALEQVAQLDGTRYDVVCVLEPTSPFRTAQDVTVALTLMLEREADSVMGLMQADFVNPGRLRVIRAGRVERLFPDFSEPGTPQQRMEPCFQPGGGLYAAQCALVVAEHTLYGHSQVGYVLPNDRGFDLDTLDDFVYAEWLYARQTEELPTGDRL